MKKITFYLIMLCHLGFSQINSNRDPDFLFNPGLNISGIENLIVQPDNKIIVASDIRASPQSSQHSLFRLNMDGTVDSAFKLPTFVSFSQIYGLALQSDGKIIAVGETVETYSNSKYNNAKIIRLNSNGNIDNTFSVGTGFNDAPNVVKLQTDGKILIGGKFTSYNGVLKNKIIRLNVDGSVDNSFIHPGFHFTSEVASIEIQSDGKILVGCKNTAPYLTRLNNNGSYDQYFYIGAGPDRDVNAITIQSDGKILIGGRFSLFDNKSAKGLTRLTSSGNLDTSFTNSNFDDTIKTILENGKNIFIGGNFKKVNSVSKECFVALKNNGTIDTSFDIGLGFQGTSEQIVNYYPIEIACLALQQGKLLIAGNHSYYNGTSSPRLTRLFGNSLSINNFKFDKDLLIFPNPSNDYVQVNIPIFISYLEFEVYDLIGKKIKSGILNENKIDVSQLNKGTYLLNLKTKNQVVGTKKFIKQ